MDVSWNSLVEDLQHFPGSALQLEAASQWEGAGSAFVEVSLELGEVFESKRLKFRIATDGEGTRITLAEDEVDQESEVQEGKQRRRGGALSRVKRDVSLRKRREEQAVPEGVADVVREASAAVASGSGPLFVRSAVLRLCQELYLELSSEQSRALSALGRRRVAWQQPPEEQEDEVEAPAAALPLLRDTSRATSGGMSALSFEELESGMETTDSEDDRPKPQTTVSKPISSLRCSEDFDSNGPPVEEVLTWTAATEGLKKFPGSELELKSAGCWDGKEGLLELVLRAPAEYEWDRLEVVVIVSARRATSVEIKGAQVVPTKVAIAVAEVNDRQDMGTGPQSLPALLGALCRTLALELDDRQKACLEALGNREKTLGFRLREALVEGRGDSDLEREMLAVEALKVQLGFIEQQITHLEHRQACAVCLAPELQPELERLRRSMAEVSAERAAAAAAVQAAMLELTDTTSKSTNVEMSVRLHDEPSQSLRGHGVEEARELIRKGLASSGAWGHYAAHQFSTMVKREQELHGDFVCFYHSYSFASLLYEVQAEVARHVLGLPVDSAPVPRLSAASDACADLVALRRQGGRDHDPTFRALGLSCSCSIFAYGSEAPPMSCFQGGYSCTDVSFRQLLVDFLTKCCGDSSHGERLADAVVEAGDKHALSVQPYKKGARGVHAAGGPLTGYMLQIFVHRSIAEEFVYPSLPMGTPIQKRILEHLEDGVMADGQARILFQPSVFLDPARVRLYHYCARPLQSCMDSDVKGSRGCLIKDLKQALRPLFDSQTLNTIKQRLKLK